MVCGFAAGNRPIQSKGYVASGCRFSLLAFIGFHLFSMKSFVYSPTHMKFKPWSVDKTVNSRQVPIQSVNLTASMSNMCVRRCVLVCERSVCACAYVHSRTHARVNKSRSHLGNDDVAILGHGAQGRTYGSYGGGVGGGGGSGL